MRRHLLCCAAVGTLLFPNASAPAQSTIDALDRDLTEAQQQHVEVSNKIITAFFAQADAGMASPSAAVTLFTDPAGLNAPPPPPAPVITVNEHETQTEKEARDAIDQANLARFGAALQLHCGLLHYGALFVLEPSRPGLQTAWIEWLKSAVPIYVQLAPPIDRTAQPDPEPPPPSTNRDDPHAKRTKHDRDLNRAAKVNPYVPNDVRAKTLRDSLITKFNGFTGFDQGKSATPRFNSFDSKDPGSWSVNSIPSLYRTTVLDPLRAKPSLATLSAWDNVIAMADADEPDNDRWNNDVNPGLQFERANDAYLASPNMEKLTTLVAFIKQYPTHPRIEDWINRVHGYIQDYRASHGGRPAASAAATTTTTPGGATTPAASVTTEQQGDMTIITTHTNGAPVAPAPPPSPAPAQ